MVIHPSGTFSYVARVPAMSGSEIELRAKNSEGWNGPSLVGPEPRVIVRRNEIVIVADSRRDASSWKFTFWPGDALSRFMQAGDEVRLSRGGTGDLGVSLVRTGVLVLAVGSIGGSIGGVGVEDATGAINFRSDVGEVSLAERECGQLGKFDLYVERLYQRGFPGRQHSVAISWRGIPGLKIEALRSAIFLAHSEGKIVGWEFFGEGAESR